MTTPGKPGAGLPEALKAGVEQLSGVSLNGAKVHFNSPWPRRLAAHEPADEPHPPHDAWHVVQQHPGRAEPTPRTHGATADDDLGLEREADILGDKAVRDGADS